MLPIIGIAGKAGSGKDTVGHFMEDDYGAVCIAFADPLKRMAMELVGQHVGFTEKDLWGSSKNRETLFRMSGEAKGLIEKSVFENDSKMDKAALVTLISWWDNFIKDRHEITPRHVLQTLGTEWGRKVDPHMWVKPAMDTSFRLLYGGYDYLPAKGLIPNKNTSVPLVVITDCRFRNEVLGIAKNGGKVVLMDSPSSTSLSEHRSERELDDLPLFYYDYIMRNTRSGDPSKKEEELAELRIRVQDAMEVLLPVPWAR